MAKNVDVSHINERRLRPIYDCLDNGNNKKALQEAEKVLKKQKGFSCAKVLKALALLRMGRQDESVSILRDVHNESPTDDSTLQAMTICYRELHKIELIADVYELAIKKEPTNEELHSHLFMAYVRMSEYKKQQLAAMTLYKLKPKNPYYFWAVMSIYMQAICAKDQIIAQKIHLPLAEKMCRKFYDEGKIEAEAEVELYLMVLEKQHNYSEMLKVMESSIGEKLNNYLDFLSRRKADIFKLIGRHKEAHDAYTSLIENNVDQIEYYTELYDISIVLDEELDSANESLIDGKRQSYHSYQYLSSLLEFIDNRVDKTSREKLAINFHIKSLQRQRGPYLAKMLIYELIKKRAQTQGDIQHLLNSISSSLTDLLTDYYKDFGSKQACIYDIYFVLGKSDIKTEEIDFFMLQLKQLLLNLSDLDDKDLNEMQKHVCYYYLAHYLGQHDSLTDDERNDIVRYLLNHYVRCYDNMGVNYGFTDTEPQPTDQYIILIPDILLVEKNEFDDSLVFQLLVIMEWALTKSPSNFYFKIQIMKLYNSVGAVSSSHVYLDALDIKHIQYDSLGYLFLPPLITCGHLNSAEQFISNALKFYSANSKDTLDYLISCYKYGSFTKVEEIIKLRDKLNNSIQYCSVAIERMILDLILDTKNHSMTENIINCMEIDPEFDRFVWNELCDNRDYSVLRCNHLKTEKTLEKRKQQSFNDELVWLKLRHLQIRAIAAAHYLVSSNLAKNELLVNKNNNNKNDTNGTESNRNITEIITFCEYVSTLESMRSTFLQSIMPIESPQPSRISHYCKRNYSQVISSLFQFILALNNEPKEINSGLSDINSGDIFVSIITEVETTVKDGIRLTSMRCVLEELTICIETLSIAVILLGISQSIMKNNMNISNRKNKKKKENRELSENYEFIVKIYMSLVNKFEQSATLLENTIKLIDFLSVISSQTYYLVQLDEIDSFVTCAKEKMRQSFAQSIKELETLLQNKLKYLQTLKF